MKVKYQYKVSYQVKGGIIGTRDDWERLFGTKAEAEKYIRNVKRTNKRAFTDTIKLEKGNFEAEELRVGI